jgi:hypothetical protein
MSEKWDEDKLINYKIQELRKILYHAISPVPFLQVIVIAALEKIPLAELFVKFDTTNDRFTNGIQLELSGFCSDSRGDTRS